MSVSPDRVKPLNDRAPREGDFVLYLMQQSQRAQDNDALEYAAAQANRRDLPLVVCFGLTSYPEANLRHYTFMLEGLAETAATLRQRRIQFVLQLGEPSEVALKIGRRAALIVTDRGYLRIQKVWRKKLASAARCPVVDVESDVVVPIEIASDKQEFAARTLRPKLERVFEKYLVRPPKTKLEKGSLGLELGGEEISSALLRRLQLDDSVPAVTSFFRGGTGAAETIFRRFLRAHFRNYREHRNQPQTSDVSHMSKYLHFGQISPVWLALEARKQKNAGAKNVASFIDELLVRRELAMNFCHFNEAYDTYGALPEWARKSLGEHRRDKRAHVYSRAELEAGATYDPYWNAAMREMRVSGYMHNYMRMYWGKKILEWSPSPEEAHATVLAINNKFFLDGRDANSFANVGWLFGLHDRPWPERSVFGKVRYMNAAGLERKCDIRAYVAKVNALSE
ncbi:MAG: deoxyribodipyrimidine photo-lyase [Chthoniobacterales bacterium]|nr:deoxyribodipyrimidine photo-lyase [Chthoniobacterales bacterium]